MICLLENTIFFIGVLKAATYFYNKLLDSVLQWPMSTFDSTPIGRILTILNDDVYVLDNIIGIKMSSYLTVLVRVSISQLKLYPSGHPYQRHNRPIPTYFIFQYVVLIALTINIIPTSFIVIIPLLIIFYVIRVSIF